MKIEHKKINFQDNRGFIMDIFTGDSKDHSTLIFSKKGSVRGNHYHKKSIQYVFVISGEMTAYSQKLGDPDKKIEKHSLRPGDLITHHKNEIHAFVANKNTYFIAFAEGLRGGKNYEKDTFRISEPLEKQ